MRGALALVLAATAAGASGSAGDATGVVPDWLAGRWCYGAFAQTAPAAPAPGCEEKLPLACAVIVPPVTDPDARLGTGCLTWAADGVGLKGERWTRYSGRNDSVELQRIVPGKRGLLYRESSDEGLRWPRREVTSGQFTEVARRPGEIVFARGGGRFPLRVAYRRSGDVLEIERSGPGGQRDVEHLWRWPSPPVRPGR